MAEVDAVLWATGYHDDSKWVAIPKVKDTGGGLVHRRGVSPMPDLYLMGRG
jgi:putative flavoprotein involved in K+ transport